jgi:ATP-dependent protease HslVU (ClpYQ) peptidase subunit
MTVIAGYTKGGQWAIASDSGVFESGENGVTFKTKGTKVWKRDDSLIGAAGGSRACELAELSMSGDPKSIVEFMRKGEATGDWNVLVVMENEIFYIGDDFSLSRIDGNYMAIGAASAPALGALCAMDDDDVDASTKVRAAANAAVKHHVWAVGPVKVLSMKGVAID